MPADRSVRTLVASMLFVLALFLGMNYLVEGRPAVDWWLPLLLFVGGLAALIALRPRREVEREAPAASLTAGIPGGYVVREYTFPERAPVAALAAERRDEPGEIHVDEPRDEDESEVVSDEITGALDTGGQTPVDPHVPDSAAPRAIDAPPPPDVVPDKTADERALDDLTTGGVFAPPSSPEGVLDPPTQSDSDSRYVIERPSPVSKRDPARSEMPLTPITEPETPARSGAERMEEDGVLLQPSETKETEFQEGEHVAHDQPTESAPPVTQTTGEGSGSGQQVISPEEKEVLDTTAAPHQPDSRSAVDPSRPDIAEAVLRHEESPEVDEALAPSDTIRPTSAAEEASPTTANDLTVVSGIGPKVAQALRAAGIDSYTKLSMASDDEIRAAVQSAGIRLTPSLSTWRQQATFLARGDREGFEALLNAQRGRTVQSDVDADDQKQTNFTDPGRS